MGGRIFRVSSYGEAGGLVGVTGANADFLKTTMVGSPAVEAGFQRSEASTSQTKQDRLWGALEQDL